MLLCSWAAHACRSGELLAACKPNLLHAVPVLSIIHLASLLHLYCAPLALQVLESFTTGSLLETVRQVQRRLARLAGSDEAGAKTALGQMLALLLQLGHVLKAAGHHTGQISFAHMLAMWAQQSGLKARPSTGIPESRKRWGSVHLDTELQTTLLLVLLHQKLQHQQISWHPAKKLHRADQLMEEALAEARDVIGRLQRRDQQLRSTLRQLVQEGLLCFKLCGADLKGLLRLGMSTMAEERAASTLRSTIIKQCEAWAQSQQRALTSIIESE